MPTNHQLITRLWWHITFCVGGIMTKPNDVGASTSSQEHISAAVLPIFCNAMDVLASPCAGLICPTNHMLHHTKKVERYLLRKRYLVLFLRKKSWWGSSILSASSKIDSRYCTLPFASSQIDRVRKVWQRRSRAGTHTFFCQWNVSCLNDVMTYVVTYPYGGTQYICNHVRLRHVRGQHYR